MESHRWTLRWVENWLNCWAQRIVISSTKHNWGPVISGKGSDGGWHWTWYCLMTFNSLSDGIESTMSMFVEDTKLEGTVECRAALQRYLNRLEKWLYRNLMEFNRSICIMLCLGWNNSTGQYRLAITWLAGSFLEKVWLTTCWTWAIKCACVAKKTRCILNFI